MADLPSKRLRTTSPSPTLSNNTEKCIICQKTDLEHETTSTENGRARIIEAAGIRKDIVFERLKQADHSKITYHVSNDCYKKYTHKKILEKLRQSNFSSTAADPGNANPSPWQSTSTADQRSRRSIAASRDSACRSEDVDLFAKKCFVCGNANITCTPSTEYLKKKEQNRSSRQLPYFRMKFLHGHVIFKM